MCVSSWGKDAEHFTGKTSSSALRKKYYEVFPRLRMNGQDVVQKSLRHNKTSMLNGYTFNCLYGQSTSDIRIDPLRDIAGNVVGAKVAVYEPSGMPWSSGT